MRILGVLVLGAIILVMLFILPRDDTNIEPNVVVCYAALDKPFSKPLLDEFQRQTGIRVETAFDSESTKTIGLVSRIVSEAARPRCDVFWNNEIVNSIRLQRNGLLVKYAPQAAVNFPKTFRAADGSWTGFAARARVLIVNTALVPPAEIPRRFSDLLQEKWRGKIGMAKPQFGSTATWLTVLYAHDQAAKKSREKTSPTPLALLERLAREGYLRVGGGNKQTAQDVSAGNLAMGFTDTDDAIIEKENGKPVAIVFLEGDDDGIGALFFPNTLMIIKNAPHPTAAQKLVEFLLSKEVEIALAKSPSAQIPLNPAIKAGADYTPRFPGVETTKAMPVDWQAVADHHDAASQWAARVFGN